MYDYLKYQVANGVATITLNRPEVYNAFNDGLTFEMQTALKSVKKDPKIRVVVITGSGKAFCSGQDLKDASNNPDRSFSESIHKRYNPMIKRMFNKSQAATLEEMLEYEAYCQDIAGASSDYQEGIRAFMEKRSPEFKGN